MVREIDRLLVKQRGGMVFTDPMAAEGADQGALRPILKRLHLENLRSVGFYKEFRSLGFKNTRFDDRTDQIVVHYSKVLQELEREGTS